MFFLFRETREILSDFRAFFYRINPQKSLTDGWLSRNAARIEEGRLPASDSRPMTRDEPQSDAVLNKEDIQRNLTVGLIRTSH